MEKIDFRAIDALVQLSVSPLTDEFLESVPRNKGDHYYRFFYHLIRQWKPEVALEIGVEKGQCFVHMLRAIQDNEFGFAIGVDLTDKALGRWYHQIASEVDHAFLCQDSRTVDVEKVLEGRKIDIVFQDSSHHYLKSHEEFEHYSPWLSENAIWVCDDITESFYDTDVDPVDKGMNQYFEELPGEKKLYQDVLHYGNRMGVILL